MFGVDLTTRVKLEGCVVPNILNVCMQEIQSRGKFMHTQQLVSLLLELSVQVNADLCVCS